LVKFLTDEGEIVLDPFGGSNTTGAVAENLKRKWLCFELDEEYLRGSIYRFDPSKLLEVQSKRTAGPIP
jgi:site-specific DNA-methyltransferase (cytosine-N4-specific)